MPEGKAEVCTRRDQEALGVRAVGLRLPARPGCQVCEHDRLYGPADHESGAVEGIREAERREAQADGEEQRADLAVDRPAERKSPEQDVAGGQAQKPRDRGIRVAGFGESEVAGARD